MAGMLAQVQAEMTDATTLEQVRDVAAEAERLMRRGTATGSASCDSMTWD
jgi:hypothetical protein